MSLGRSRPMIVEVNGVVINLAKVAACRIRESWNYVEVILTLPNGETVCVDNRVVPEAFDALVRWYHSVPRVEDVW